jgi:hypothetical protein
MVNKKAAKTSPPLSNVLPLEAIFKLRPDSSGFHG